eukprot:5623650-Prymnesium_polylepis.1
MMARHLDLLLMRSTTTLSCIARVKQKAVTRVSVSRSRMSDTLIVRNHYEVLAQLTRKHCDEKHT